MKHDKNIQFTIACSILEFFNNGGYVNKQDIQQEKDTFRRDLYSKVNHKRRF